MYAKILNEFTGQDSLQGTVKSSARRKVPPAVGPKVPRPRLVWRALTGSRPATPPPVAWVMRGPFEKMIWAHVALVNSAAIRPNRAIRFICTNSFARNKAGRHRAAPHGAGHGLTPA